MLAIAGCGSPDPQRDAARAYLRLRLEDPHLSVVEWWAPKRIDLWNKGVIAHEAALQAHMSDPATRGASEAIQADATTAPAATVGRVKYRHADGIEGDALIWFDEAGRPGDHATDEYGPEGGLAWRSRNELFP